MFLHNHFLVYLQTFPQQFPEILFGIRVRTFGHHELFKSRSLILMNHICHFDWLFFWSVLERNGDVTSWKAVTKDMIKKFPLLGTGMSRVHVSAQSVLIHQLNNHTPRTGHNYLLLIVLVT